MSENKIVPDEELPTLTRTELIAIVRSARKHWRQRDIEFHALKEELDERNTQLAEAESQLHEASLGAEAAAGDDKTIEALGKDNAELRERVTSLENALDQRDTEVEDLNKFLEELCTPIAVACRNIGDAKQKLKPYWKKESTGNGGGQHGSAPSK